MMVIIGSRILHQKGFIVVIEKMIPVPWNGSGILIICRYWYGNGI
jgi:hypothetical protein